MTTLRPADLGEILIVDDEPSVVEVVALYLRREGFRVRTARDGAEALLALGAEVATYDPVALAQARIALGERTGLRLLDQAHAVLEGADALVIVTEWKEFRSPDFAYLAATLRQPVIFDGRNLFEPADMHALGFEYHAIGRSAP